MAALQTYWKKRDFGKTAEPRGKTARKKGFGYVTPDEAGKDLFVHHTGIIGDGYKSLAEGAKVSYDAEAGDKGPKAVNVQVL